MAKTYRTEREARLDYVLTCTRYCGIAEGGEDHRALLWWYNHENDGYKMTVNDPWCAAFLSAVAKKLGYEKFPTECSCSRMIEKAKGMGLRIEERGYVPEIGDWLIYDWGSDSRPDHIGTVAGVEGETMWITEGNYSNTVKSRKIRVDDPRIHRYICPDYMELVDNGNFAEGDRPNVPIEIPEIKEEDEDMKIYNDVDEMPEWAQEPVADLVEIGVIQGVGGGELGLSALAMRIAVMLWRGMSYIAKRCGVSLK